MSGSNLAALFRLPVLTYSRVRREYWVFYFALGQRATSHLLVLLFLMLEDRGLMVETVASLFVLKG